MNTPIGNFAQRDVDFRGFRALNLGSSPGANAGTLVNVQNAPYNATGLGIADDTVAIQSAINDMAAAGGGTVFMPKGIYLCNGPFDATTNSVLRFPYVPLQSSPGVWNLPVTIELRGESVPAVDALAGAHGSIIKCTKTGTGSQPSILAAYSFLGRVQAPSYLTAFSYVQPVLRNLSFEVPANPTIDGVRFDTAVMAILEDVVVSTPGDGTQPTHDTVGIWMPGVQNFATAYANRVWVQGFYTGLVAADHFRSPQTNALDCQVGVEFLSSAELGWAVILIDHCFTGIKFTASGSPVSRYPIDLVLGIEQMDVGWQTPTATSDIVDTSNVGSGEIRYWVMQINVGIKHIGVTGGANLKLIDTSDVYGAVTVATLPMGVLGRTAVVTDGAAGLAVGAIIAGGGTAKYLVWWNGVSWTVIGK
jgi:hypothetical protein